MNSRAGERVDDAVDAAQAALTTIRAMPGSQARANEAGRLARELRKIANEATSVLREEAWRIRDEEGLTLAPLAKKLGVSRSRAHEFLQSRPDEPVPEEPSTMPEPQPVVAAIVSSNLGALVGRRRDGKPEWTFIAGEIEPGESPADAAVREVKEETGLEIRAGRIIGRRVHPATGRSMVYMAAWPVHGTEVMIGDEDELAEVRWATLAELRKLMGNGIFEPVMKHLKRTLEE